MAEKKSKRWIARAVANSKGKFAEKARRAGKTTSEFASEHASSEGVLGREARLAETLSEMRRRKLYTKGKAKTHG